MRFFSLLMIVLVGFSGIYAGVVGFKEYINMTKVVQKVPNTRVLKTALCFGIAGASILFAIVLVASSLEQGYVWNFSKIESGIFIALILGCLVTLGSLYQIYTTLILKDTLIKKSAKKDSSDNRPN